MKINSLLSLILLFIGTVAFAQKETEEKWYQVELLVFKQTNQDDEIINREINLEWPKPLTRIEGEERFITSPNSLNSVNRRLSSNWGYRMLWHEAWYQQGISNEEAPWVMVQGGHFKHQRNELEGAFRLYLSRYFHLETNLWFTEFIEEEALEQPERFNAEAINTAVEGADLLNFVVENTIMENSEIFNSDTIPQPKWPTLPELPKLIDKRNCPAYDSMPVLMRKHLFGLKPHLTLADNNSDTETTILEAAKDPVEQKTASFYDSVVLEPKGTYPYCEFSTEVDAIIDPITEQSIVLEQWQQIEARHELEQYLWLREVRTKVATSVSATMPGNLQRFLENPFAIGQQAQVPVESIHLMKQEQRILINKSYYIDHPEIGIIVTIKPVDKETIDQFNPALNPTLNSTEEASNEQPN